MKYSLGRVARAFARRIARSLPLFDSRVRLSRGNERWLDDFYDRDPGASYELRKYGDLLDSLEGRRFRRGWEIGCSTGDFTGQLAGFCDELLATDISPVAVSRARARLARRRSIRIERRSFPQDGIVEPADLIVCSDVLYYLDESLLRLAVARIEGSLRPGGTFVAVHCRGEPGVILDGDEVHGTLLRRFFAAGWIHARSERRTGIGPYGAGYCLDRFDRPMSGA
jgi:hypothetical protein